MTFPTRFPSPTWAPTKTAAAETSTTRPCAWATASRAASTRERPAPRDANVNWALANRWTEPLPSLTRPLFTAAPKKPPASCAPSTQGSWRPATAIFCPPDVTDAHLPTTGNRSRPWMDGWMDGWSCGFLWFPNTSVLIPLAQIPWKTALKYLCVPPAIARFDTGASVLNASRHSFHGFNVRTEFCFVCWIFDVKQLHLFRR